MKAIELKERVDKLCQQFPNMAVLLKIEHEDGSYNVCNIDAMFEAGFNGLFLLQPEIHETGNCAILTGSEIPANEFIDFEDNREILLDKAAAEQAYLDGAMDSKQFIQVLTDNGYLNLP